jgi:hypothetical protein
MGTDLTTHTRTIIVTNPILTITTKITTTIITTMITPLDLANMSAWV